VAIGAERCDIYTDVDGVYTSDPCIVPRAHARPIAYEEMLSLPRSAPRSCRCARSSLEWCTRIRALELRETRGHRPAWDATRHSNAARRDRGTAGRHRHRLQRTRHRSDPPQDKPGIAVAIFGPLADANINVDMIVQNVSGDGANTD
jgi:aspartate kinase